MLRKFLLPLSLLLFYGCFSTIHLSVALSDQAQLTRSRLQQSLSSLAGKLTISPEVVIPDTSDPTAILLQNSATQAISANIRAAKANAAFLQGPMGTLQAFCSEQEMARGNFPGPIPCIYDFRPSKADVETQDEKGLLSEVAEAGADGLLVRICDGNEVTCLEDLSSSSKSWATCQVALSCGLQPIPELTVSQATASAWTPEDVTKWVEGIESAAGMELVSVLLTINPAAAAEDAEEEFAELVLPTIPKDLGKRVAVLGSVRTKAGENRLNVESARFKAAGYTGAVLRNECVPGYESKPDLTIMSRFWPGIISELKSTKSKNFSFRSKNNMEKSVGTQWANYQKDVLDSGSLGDPDESFSVLDEDAGEYKGFA